MAEPVIESSFLGLVYSVLAGSELLIVNQAEGLIQWKVLGWPQQVLNHICPGFGWDRVNFLPSSWYSAVFWI